MATLATILDRFTAAKSLDQAAPRTRVLEHEDAFEVPAFPNEDVYFYIKRINNSQVLREADPAARRACWKLIGSSLVIAALVIGLPAGAVGMVWTEGAGAAAEQPRTVTAMATPIPAIRTRDLRAALVSTVLPPQGCGRDQQAKWATPINPHIVKKAILPTALPTEPSL